MTPGQTAMVDQSIASFGAELTRLVKTFHALAANHGREQALCDVTTLIASVADGSPFADMERPAFAALIAVAVMRLDDSGVS